MALQISKEFKVGFFIVLAIAILYWGFNFLKGNDIFASGTSFYAVYNNTEGLTPAKAVQINGYQVGLIDKIYFHPDKSGRLVVKIKMQEEYPIPTNTKALIHSSGLLGEKNIQLILGTSTDYAVNGDTLLSGTEESLTDAVNAQVAPIKAKAEKLLGSLDTAATLLTGFLNEETRDNFKQSFESLNRTFMNLEKSSTLVEAYLQNNEQHFNSFMANLSSISANLKSNNENITKVLGNLSSITDSIQKANITETFLKVNHAVAQLDEVFSKINSGEGSLGELVNDPALYNNLEDATFSLNRLLLDIKYNPNKYLQFSVFGSNKTYSDDEIAEIEEELKRQKELKNNSDKK